MNQSQKKREKRKAKKQQEMELKAIAEAKALKELDKKRKADYLEAKARGMPLPVEKQFKKKVLPKKVIPDADGAWEVTDIKKSVLVEQDDSEEDSLSD